MSAIWEPVLPFGMVGLKPELTGGGGERNEAECVIHCWKNSKEKESKDTINQV